MDLRSTSASAALAERTFRLTPAPSGLKTRPSLDGLAFPLDFTGVPMINALQFNEAPARARDIPFGQAEGNDGGAGRDGSARGRGARVLPRKFMNALQRFVRMKSWGFFWAVVLGAGAMGGRAEGADLRNPVWVSEDNLRDPSVLKVEGGYQVFYSRFAGADWSSPKSWTIARAFTKEFAKFEDVNDISPKGHASPGDVVFWHGRYLLPYQSYPAKPTLLCVSESTDLRQWTAPRTILSEAAQLPWNTYKRVIDPSFVVEGDVLHCFFVGSADVTDAKGLKQRANLLGHAITRDPKLEKWEILTPKEPLLGHSAGAPDGVENVMVFRTGEHWTMIYSEGLADQHLALATSTDLRAWKLEGPIEIPRQKWMARKYGAPFVWRDGEEWRMILMGENGQRRTTFGLLSSRDGRHWIPLPE